MQYLGLLVLLNLTLYIFGYELFKGHGRLYVASTNDVQLAKWLAGKRKQPRYGHLFVLSLCGRVIERVREVTIR